MSLVRKKKERGGGGGKTMADGPSASPRQGKFAAINRKSVENQKENPPATTRKNAVATRSTSRGRGLSLRNAQDASAGSEQHSPRKPAREKTRQSNPIQRSGARIPSRGYEDSKKSAKERESSEDGGLRWSTSSLPANGADKGKKLSEPAFSRILSDLQRERRSRLNQKALPAVSVSQDGAEWLGDRIPPLPSPAVREAAPRAGACDPSEEIREARVSEDGRTGEEDKGVLVELGSSVPAPGGSKFPSKLHERLAFLEGRVNQIASELRKTKEMLDANNAEASKSMISDIQVKICGIERAMTFSASDDPGRAEAEAGNSLPETLGAQRIAWQEGCVTLSRNPSEEIAKRLAGGAEKGSNSGGNPNENGAAAPAKHSIKRLNHHELEERLFPHHKLLKNRPSVHLAVLKTRANSDGELKKNACLSAGGGALESGPLSPIDEDPIAVEFLTSLNQRNSLIAEYNGENGNAELKATESGGANVAECELKSKAGSSLSHENGNENIHNGSDDRDSVKDIEIDESEPQLECNENLSLNDQENNPVYAGIVEEIEEIPLDRLNQLGHKTSTAGWFVLEGESILLAHEDGCCSFHDIANSEEKAEYKGPEGLTPSIWGDCWLIRAAGSDGRSGKYVVAASAGSTLDSGFCSWDFYTKEVMAFHTDPDVFSTSGAVCSALSDRSVSRRNSSFANVVPENQHWWYRPCGPLLVSAASSQRMVSIYDIRDGDLVMNWEAQRVVTNMNYSSPLQWRNRGKVVLAENEAISLWDVNSLDPSPLQCVAFPGRKVSALHMHNPDAECSGGVRHRVSSSEAEGNDGVFCTQEAIYVFDFRVSSGIGLKIPTFGEIGQAIFARGDSIFAGVVNTRFSSKVPVRCRVYQWSIRKGKPVCMYTFPESNTHFEHFSVAQVWGSSHLIMAINGNGLFVFDTCHEDGGQDAALDHLRTKGMREVVGPDDLYCPSFDYSGSRILLVSKDRPACWRRCWSWFASVLLHNVQGMETSGTPDLMDSIFFFWRKAFC